MYRQSFYNIIEKNSDGRAALFNTRTGGVVVLNSIASIELINLLERPNDFPHSDLLKSELIKRHFIIEDTFDELNAIKKLHESSIDIPSMLTLPVTIAPTKLCNFGCPYCYVKETDSTTMSEEVYSKIYNYINKKIMISKQNYQDKQMKLQITWFGGEPTLESKNILKFMEKMIDLSRKYTVELDSFIITNGYLLDYNLFKKFVSKKITKFQITLDGDGNNHDKSRYLKTNNQPTFDKIYSNILEIKEKASPDLDYKISIRSNITKSNIEQMKDFKERVKRDLNDKRIFHYFDYAYKYNSRDSVVNSNLFDNCEGLCQTHSLNMENAIKFCKNHSIDELYKMLPRPKRTSCMVYNDSYVVFPSGKITSCMAVDSNHSIGEIKVNGSILFNDALMSWKQSIFQEKATFSRCYKCNLLPICMGGCKFNFFCNSELKCSITEDNVRKVLQLYLEEYLDKEKTNPSSTMTTRGIEEFL